MRRAGCVAVRLRVAACCGQVLLLPNFVSTVTREIYQSADGALDTIDLLEQVRSCSQAHHAFRSCIRQPFIRQLPAMHSPGHAFASSSSTRSACALSPPRVFLRQLVCILSHSRQGASERMGARSGDKTRLAGSCCSLLGLSLPGKRAHKHSLDYSSAIHLGLQLGE